ncbi:MAG: alanine racemase [Cyanobacteria bacterium J06623_7]
MVSWQQQRVDRQQSDSDRSVSRQRAWVEIDLKALAHNVRVLKAWLNPTTKLMAVVKADAYGHGAVVVARTALIHGADSLAIATLAEGVELRRQGIEAPILILGAINAVEDIKALAAWELSATICSAEQALIFDRTLGNLGKTAAVHLQLDTGMSRLGTNWQHAREFASYVRNLPNLEIASIYSHLATADEPERYFLELQHQRFQTAISRLQEAGLQPPMLHLANSAATLSDRTTHYDMVRIGLALYGLAPAPHLAGIVELKPVLQVKAKVTQVKTIPAHEGVSYGRQYVTSTDTRVAVVGIGYADGVPRNLSNHLQAIVGGQLVPQIGAITMDQLMLRLEDRDQVQPGDVVTLIGREDQLEVNAEDWAKPLQTISWEILCGFKHRLPRIFIEP